MAKHALLEFILNAATGALTTIGESKLEDVLQQLHDKNPEQYKAAIFGGIAFVSALQPIVQKTSTNIDDALLAAIQDAVETSAKANGISLP